MATSSLGPYRLETTHVDIQHTSEVDAASGEAYRAQTSDERLRRSWAGPRGGKGVKRLYSRTGLGRAWRRYAVILSKPYPLTLWNRWNNEKISKGE